MEVISQTFKSDNFPKKIWIHVTNIFGISAQWKFHWMQQIKGFTRNTIKKVLDWGLDEEIKSVVINNFDSQDLKRRQN